MRGRRDFTVAIIVGVLAAPLAALAQQVAGRVRRIGVLLTVAEDDPALQVRFSAFAQALRGMGWIEGQNVVFEKRYAGGDSRRLPALAAELVSANVDVIVCTGTPMTEAARKATSTIPIVMSAVGDAVGSGLVASLARPGGNVTGQSMFAVVQASKRLQLMREISPGLSRFATIWSAENSAHRLELAEMESAAKRMKIVLRSFPVRNADDIAAAFRAVAEAKLQAIVTMDDQQIQFHRVRIVELAMQGRIPVVGEFEAMAVSGALISYGADLVEMWRRMAAYVDRILKGANPAEMPVEQPTRFNLVVNMKTARALGIRIPHSILVRADRVIE
jgi:putative ABC transport system substrate-binding protein